MDKTSINKDMRLSPHFTLGELCKTSYHKHNKSGTIV